MHTSSPDGISQYGEYRIMLVFLSIFWCCLLYVLEEWSVRGLRLLAFDTGLCCCACLVYFSHYCQAFVASSGWLQHQTLTLVPAPGLSLFFTGVLPPFSIPQG